MSLSRINFLWFNCSDRGFTVFSAFLPLLPISLFCLCCALLVWKSVLICVVCPCVCLSASRKLLYYLCLPTSILWTEWLGSLLRVITFFEFFFRVRMGIRNYFSSSCKCAFKKCMHVQAGRPSAFATYCFCLGIRSWYVLNRLSECDFVKA